ncbi:MAG TPA: hypothetical protein DCZ69_11635 [Syntrophobacteraceae bacterium]|jgi:hypothetical protein|nr:hypothetical protein [Syntrophobacteraceae bacterium]HBD08902.1 hypothetical protein [Syntrophobacteraceae bacterium]HBZ54956.1 hypothetical protein [Syntrophobacteraceae bacterium]
MTTLQHPLLAYTVAHFQEIARQNRFPENNKIPHDSDHCLICHPELLPMEPFAIYLEVVTQSVKVRRPAWDKQLVDAINSDRELLGLPPDVSLLGLQTNAPADLTALSDWLRDAINTGLELLAIHSATSMEFCLDDAATSALQDLVADKVEEIVRHQMGRETLR